MTAGWQLHRRVADRVLTLVIDVPGARNAVSPGLSRAIVAAVDDAAADDAIGAIVLTGAGAVFSAGGDIGGLVASLEQPAPADEQRAAFQTSIDAALALADSPKPTLAAINGSCAGGGLGLALACDLRLASDCAKFAYAYPQLALAGDFAVNWSLTRVLGPARARHFCLLSERLDARAALAIELVHEVVDDAALAGRAHELARRLAARPAIVARQIKQNLDAAWQGSRAEALRVEADNFLAARADPAHLDAARAFLAGRPATDTPATGLPGKTPGGEDGATGPGTAGGTDR